MGLFISKLGFFLSKLIVWKKDGDASAQNHGNQRNDREQISDNSDLMTDEETDHSSVRRRWNPRSELDDDNDDYRETAIATLTVTSHPGTDTSPSSYISGPGAAVENSGQTADQTAQQLEQLDNRNRDLQEIVQVLQYQFDEDRRQKQRMMQKLASLAATCTENQHKLQNLEEEGNKWKKEKKEFEVEQHRRHVKQLEDKDKAIKQLQKEFQKMQEKQGKLLQKLEETNNKVMKLESDCHETQGHQSEQNRMLCHQLEEMKNAMYLFELSCPDAQGQLAAQLQEKLDTHTLVLQDVQGHMEATEQQFVALQMWTQQTDSALEELRREAEVRDHQLREYHGRMEAAEQQFVAMQMRMEQSDLALVELRREADLRDHQLREYHGHMVEAEQQIVAMQMRIEQSDLALVELRSEAEVRDHQLREYHEMQNDNVQKLMEKVSQKEEEARRYKLRFNRQTRKLRAVLLKKLRADRGNPKNLNIYIKNTIIQILNVRAQRASNSYSASSRRYPRSQEDHMLLGEMPLSIQNFD
ncbi:bromodomain-containing protein DDB_G0280777-like isoform X3 [Pomacea canaliculata]|uniref:bromodomain-containing protein DDB_G0280777-like isoform X3 n=1 Tax=Pomacea canaliculata TaxID=400727 RepID=UPI000D73EDD8|nr:bromodomain-containing protein DDB_G0280777-like isoform X3 [Pomacea canaliculata]